MCFLVELQLRTSQQDTKIKSIYRTSNNISCYIKMKRKISNTSGHSSRSSTHFKRLLNVILKKRSRSENKNIKFWASPRNFYSFLLMYAYRTWDELTYSYLRRSNYSVRIHLTIFQPLTFFFSRLAEKADTRADDLGIIFKKLTEEEHHKFCSDSGNVRYILL